MASSQAVRVKKNPADLNTGKFGAGTPAQQPPHGLSHHQASAPHWSKDWGEAHRERGPWIFTVCTHQTPRKLETLGYTPSASETLDSS